MPTDKNYICTVMIYVSRKEHFNAAHKLYNPAWTEEQNDKVFGPCANKNWHGHNFELIVTVQGEVDVETGYVMDMKVLSDLIKEEIINKVDHKNFNLDVDFMQGKMTSCENIIASIWEILEPKISHLSQNRAVLARIRLHETKNNFVEFCGHR